MAATLPEQPRSFFDALVAQKAHLIHKLRAKDTSGRWAYYFVLVRPHREAAFLRAINGRGVVDLQDHGDVIASSFGQEPTQQVRAYLKEKYGFDV